jgi:hypothetical protein
MIASSIANATSVIQLQAAFLSILPRIETHARVYFRHERCPDKKADRIAETIAVSWKWFVRLAEQGKDATQFPSVLASFAVRAVKCGRRVCGMHKAKDVMNEQTQQRRGFCVGKLPDFSTLSENPLAEALTDNTMSPVPDQVQFRCDFPDWLGSHSRRNRTLVVEMAKGETTRVLSRRFKISPARVSQLRREFHDDWHLFTDEEEVNCAQR